MTSLALFNRASDVAHCFSVPCLLGYTLVITLYYVGFELVKVAEASPRRSASSAQTRRLLAHS
eukprot:5794058-Amphidinium_carterae.1